MKLLKGAHSKNNELTSQDLLLQVKVIEGVDDVVVVGLNQVGVDLSNTVGSHFALCIVVGF